MYVLHSDNFPHLQNILALLLSCPKWIKVINFQEFWSLMFASTYKTAYTPTHRKYYSLFSMFQLLSQWIFQTELNHPLYKSYIYIYLQIYLQHIHTYIYIPFSEVIVVAWGQLTGVNYANSFPLSHNDAYQDGDALFPHRKMREIISQDSTEAVIYFLYSYF